MFNERYVLYIVVFLGGTGAVLAAFDVTRVFGIFVMSLTVVYSSIAFFRREQC